MSQTQRRQSERGDPHHDVKKIARQLRQPIDHLRGDIETIDEPRCKAMFETCADDLGGLQKAFDDTETRCEPAWR